MSVLDRWLYPDRYRRSEDGAPKKPATSATSAKIPIHNYALGVARPVVGLATTAGLSKENNSLGVAGRPSPRTAPEARVASVAGTSTGFATQKTAEILAKPSLVADVAENRGGAAPGEQKHALSASIKSYTPTAEDWRDLYEERAAIREFDGHYSRAEAERLAWGEVENRWHAEHGECLPRGTCAGARRAMGGAKIMI
jgi:hypothetical protein